MADESLNVNSRSKRVRRPVADDADTNYLMKYLEEAADEEEGSDSEYEAEDDSSDDDNEDDAKNGDSDDSDDDDDDDSSEDEEEDEDEESENEGEAKAKIDDEGKVKEVKEEPTEGGSGSPDEEFVPNTATRPKRTVRPRKKSASGDEDDESVDEAKPAAVITKVEPAVKSEKTEKSTRSIFDEKICMLCLGDFSEQDNELVECDSCGITVHEGCYGVSDTLSVSSTSSSADTEPWFCDACLADIKDPLCELCPMKGGILKRTDDFCWVHLVCALYTPGVAFNNSDTLTEVTLTEIPHKDWSSKECQLCVERLYACTGICVSCDAGLCRSFFHVTCAQKEGLLSEPNMEENCADPYFAHCRQHTDKTVARGRKRNLMMSERRQSAWVERRQRHLTLLQASKQPPTSETGNQLPNGNGVPLHVPQIVEDVDFRALERIQNKLVYMRRKYAKYLNTLIQPYVPTEKTPRYLETSPVAVRLFLEKSLFLGLPSIMDSASMSEQSKTAVGYPAFTPDFITCFIERERKIDELTQRISELEVMQGDLRLNDNNTSHQYNRLKLKAVKEREDMAASAQKLSRLTELMKKVEPSVDLTRLSIVLTRYKSLDAAGARFFSTAQTSGVQSKSMEDGKSGVNEGKNLRSQNRSGVEATTEAGEKKSRGKHTTRESQSPEREEQPDTDMFHECDKCHGVLEQHLLTQCDDCRKYYHLACLDPPLTRMPKKTRLYGWVCSWCTKNLTDEKEEPNLDVLSRRRSRKPAAKLADSANPDAITKSLRLKLPTTTNGSATSNREPRTSKGASAKDSSATTTTTTTKETSNPPEETAVPTEETPAPPEAEPTAKPEPEPEPELAGLKGRLQRRKAQKRALEKTGEEAGDAVKAKRVSVATENEGSTDNRQLKSARVSVKIFTDAMSRGGPLSSSPGKMPPLDSLKIPRLMTPRITVNSSGLTSSPKRPLPGEIFANANPPN